MLPEDGFPGAYDKKFYEFIDAGQLCLPFDARTGEALSLRRRFYPPGVTVEWRPAKGGGEVLSFTVTRRQYLPAFPVPLVHVQVALDEGPMLVARLLGVAPEAVAVGMRVAVRFDDVGLWFAPASGG